MSDSGSLAIDHRTTLGWFLSRATSSRIAWACTSRVASLIVSGREGRVALPAEDAAAEAHVEADGRGLVDDDDAVPVGVVEDVLGVRVVRRAEGVGADPVEQLEVLHDVGVAVRLADRRVVLVHAETLEVEGLAVDEELGAADLDRADADGLVVAVEHDVLVVDELDLEVVEVAVARAPRGARPATERVPVGAGARRDLARRRRRAGRPATSRPSASAASTR